MTDIFDSKTFCDIKTSSWSRRFTLVRCVYYWLGYAWAWHTRRACLTSSMIEKGINDYGNWRESGYTEYIVLQPCQNVSRLSDLRNYVGEKYLLSFRYDRLICIRCTILKKILTKLAWFLLNTAIIEALKILLSF